VKDGGPENPETLRSKDLTAECHYTSTVHELEEISSRETFSDTNVRPTQAQDAPSSSNTPRANCGW